MLAEQVITMTTFVRTHRIMIIMVPLWLIVMITPVAMAQPKLSELEQLQLEVNALTTLNSVISHVSEKAVTRESYLSEYFDEANLMAEYRAYVASLTPADPDATPDDGTDEDDADEDVDDDATDTDDTPEAPSTEDTAAPPEDLTPRAGNWSDQARDPNRAIPLTYEEVYELALEYETENNLAAARNTTRDRESLLRARESWDKIASEKFPQLLASIMDVERRVQFLRDTDRWNAFVEWAEAEYDRREEAARLKAEARTQQREQREADAAAARAQREAEREERERQKAEALEQEWQRKVEVYQLQTERIAAQQPDTVYYPAGRWWRY